MTTLDRAMAALSARLGLDEVHVLGTARLGGGCVAEALRVDTDQGAFFVKMHEGEGSMFSAEAAGLTALAEVGTRLVIPEVLAHADPAPGKPGFLVLEHLPAGDTTDMAAFGHGLAQLHRATSDRGFGFEVDTYCGATRQPNRWCADWLAFYRDHRIGHQLRLLVDAGRFGADDEKLTDRLMGRLEERLAGPEEPPALIHGDLWSGNLMSTTRGPALIDPSVAYAHREAELGMMTLFGGFGARAFSAYEEVYPLDPSWRERNPLYELYHVMNHATLFGGGYVEQALGIIRRYA
ncbi:MAG: fructosamine kinase family protein [Myxococcales bacterium]|nr:fructosamine kinase family protein [Myxococcales bacterium]